MEKVSVENMLEELLVHILGNLKRLLRIIKDERTAVIHGDLDALKKILKKKEPLKKDIEILEKNKNVIVAELGKKYGIDKSDIKLDDIILAVGGDYGKRLSEKRNILKSMFEKVSMLHAANELLIKRAINFQERAFMIAIDGIREKTGYKKNGNIERKDGGRILNKLA